MKIHFDLELNDGQMILKGRKRVLEELKMTGKTQFMGVLEAKKRKRSVAQNRFYWGCAIPIIQEGLSDTGYQLTKDEVHEFLKSKFVQVERVNEETGEVISFPGSTTELSTSDFMDLIASIQQWASEYLGCYLPDPGEQVAMNV